jgi:hypothetical protein
MDSRQIVVGLFVLTGLGLAGLAIPLMMRLIPPNPLYGFRLPKTMKDPEIWYEINAYSGRWLFAVGLLVALSSAALYVLFPGLDTDLLTSGIGIVVIIMLAVAMKASLDRLKTL